MLWTASRPRLSVLHGAILVGGRERLMFSGSNSIRNQDNKERFRFCEAACGSDARQHLNDVDPSCNRSYLLELSCGGLDDNHPNPCNLTHGSLSFTSPLAELGLDFLDPGRITPDSHYDILP